MNTRLRFTKNPETGLMRSRDLIAGEKVVYALLDLDNKRVSIRDSKNNVLITQDHPEKTLAQLKKLTKPLLESLGVVFYDETRITVKMQQETEINNNETTENK